MNSRSVILEEFERSLDVTQPNLCTNLEESAKIEFKNSLQTKSDTIDKQYLKTISGFANNEGGTIIFGISPEKKELVGIKEEFENLDNRYVSSTISHGLDGSFNFHFITKRFLGKIIGFLIIDKAFSKPVIMKSDASEHKLGEIYYRYPAQTSKILASDLRRILDNEISIRLQQTIGNISKLVEIGNDAAILDTKSGVIDAGSSLPKFILDEKILKTLNIIKIGQFVEEDGAPAYIIKGEIEGGNVEVIEKTVLSNLFPNDIINYFINGKCEHPKLVFEKLVTLTSPYYPIYFFVNELSLSIDDTVKYLNSMDVNLINEKTRGKMIERLTGQYDYGTNGIIIAEIIEVAPTNGITKEFLTNIRSRLTKKVKDDARIKRSLIYNSLKEFKNFDEGFIKEEADLIVEALSNIGKQKLLENKDYFLLLIEKLHGSISKGKATFFKKTICFMDESFYRT